MAIRNERKPRNDDDFRRAVRRLLGIRNAKVTHLEVGRFETNIGYDQWDAAVERRGGGTRWGEDEEFRRWAFGITNFTGGSVRYGGGKVRGWRDRARVREWMRARRSVGVAP